MNKENPYNYHFSWLIFKNLEDLKRKTRLPPKHKYNGGSWEKMLIYEPVIEEMVVAFFWQSFARCQTYHLRGFGKSLMVEDFALALRDFLAHAEDKVMQVADEMVVPCHDPDAHDFGRENESKVEKGEDEEEGEGEKKKAEAQFEK